MKRVFVIGDIHGAFRALHQCLERARFDYESDHLIALGDVCDGWPETKACVDELLRLKNLTYLLGNHDTWALDWMTSGRIEPVWYDQGGKATMESYRDGIPSSHVDFFRRALPYYILENKLFVHAGIDPFRPLEKQDEETFLWDRTLASLVLGRREPPARDKKVSQFDEIYIGHTPIPNRAPFHSLGVWLMDTGAGWSGVLSMMNIDTCETFISDPVPSLYPGVVGRGSKF